MWLMLQEDKPDDYVLSTGETHSVREFVELAFTHINRKIIWSGEGINEVGIDSETNEILVKISSNYFRPTEVDTLLGDANKAKKILGWTPKISFNELVTEMVKQDYILAQRDELIKTHGYQTMNYNE